MWMKTCCDVRCYACRGGAKVSTWVGTFEFTESIEKTAERCQAAALEAARKKLKA